MARPSALLLLLGAALGLDQSHLQFTTIDGADAKISWDGTTLTVPQHCRAERCGALEADIAALKAANVALEARLAALETATPPPTPVPTPHPCTDGSHGCDKTAGGICYSTGPGSYACGCKHGYLQTSKPGDSHRCAIVTPAPTPAPTPTPPTPAPTPDPDDWSCKNKPNGFHVIKPPSASGGLRGHCHNGGFQLGLHGDQNAGFLFSDSVSGKEEACGHCTDYSYAKFAADGQDEATVLADIKLLMEYHGSCSQDYVSSPLCHHHSCNPLTPPTTSPFSRCTAKAR